MYYRIYLRNFHGRDGYLEVGLQNDEIVRDFEVYLRGETYTVRRYPLKEGEGSLCIDFHEVLAIRSINYAR